MSIVIVSCPNCGHLATKVSSECAANSSVRCPNCKKSVVYKKEAKSEYVQTSWKN